MKKIHSDLILFLTKTRKEYKKYAKRHRSPEKDYSVGSYVYLNVSGIQSWEASLSFSGVTHAGFLEAMPTTRGDLT
ncbi:hypothetical protein DSO57_1029789 [Entomophthora muscae]|uniref:Uncharacterized protein n=1 Tax=Entomophthora muscae TaxID=34485 RepID=A0ACC2TN45_9FUNG|nr:hypothetical protein DSO57_1029789 [Entomophthora muscae]